MQDIEYRGEVCSVPRSTPKSTSIYQLNRYEPTRRDEGTSVQIWFCSVSTPDVKSSKNQHEMCRSWTLGRKDTVSTFASPPRASSSITGPFVCELSAQHEAGTRGNIYPNSNCQCGRDQEEEKDRWRWFEFDRNETDRARQDKSNRHKWRIDHNEQMV